MASNILPSTDYTHRSHRYPAIQHRNQPPCGIRTMKHQHRTAPPLNTWKANTPGIPFSPKAASPSPPTRHPLLPQHAGECSSPSSPRPLPKPAFTPHVLHSKMQKISLGQKAHDALQIPPSQCSHFPSLAQISQLLGSHFKTTLPYWEQSFRAAVPSLQHKLRTN